MRHTFSRPQLYVTKPPPIMKRVDYTTELVPTGKYHPIPGLDGVEPNATIHLASVELFDKYELGEHAYGRHKYKIIYATTTESMGSAFYFTMTASTSITRASTAAAMILLSGA